jgi:cell division protein FtsW
VATNVSTSLTPAQRRRAVLDKKGVGISRRLTTAAPNKVFWGILAVTSLLTVFGLMMVLSATSIEAVNRGGSPWAMFQKQFMWSIFGLFAGITTYRMPYHQWHGFAKYALWASYGLMVLPLVPGIGMEINSARAWVALGPIRFQPSEVLKVTMLLYCASVLSRRRADIAIAERTLKPVMIAWGITVFMCIIFQKDLGAAIVFTCIVMATLFIAGAPIRWMATMIGAFTLVSIVLIATSSRLQNRFFAFADLEGNKGHWAYQVWQSVLSIANGGITGVGVGQGTGKWGYVPLAHSDFIFAIIAEEFGLIGTVGVIGGFMVLLSLGMQAARGARDHYGALLAGGITAWLCVQALINIGGVIGAMPVTGLTLPLLSYGGSSLFMTMAAVGLLLNVARNMK